MSCIGKGIVVKGDVQTSESLTIDGQVDGRVTSEAQAVTVSESARVNGDILARDITVSGTTQGQLVATEVVHLRPGAHVQGHVMAPQFILDGDAFFQGRVEPQHVEAAIRVAQFQQRKRSAT